MKKQNLVILKHRGNYETFLRSVVGLDEEDVQLILKQYNSNFVTYKLTRGFYTSKDIAEVVHTMGDHEGTLQIEYDDISMKTKLILTRFGGTFGTLRFDERYFLILYWILHHIGIVNLPMLFMLITQLYTLVMKF